MYISVCVFLSIYFAGTVAPQVHSTNSYFPRIFIFHYSLLLPSVCNVRCSCPLFLSSSRCGARGRCALPSNGGDWNEWVLVPRPSGRWQDSVWWTLVLGVNCVDAAGWGHVMLGGG